MSERHTHGGTDAPECTTCRPLDAAAARDTADPADGLTAVERAQYGVRAEHFPPTQLVYSLSSVEAILAARQRPTAPPEDRVTAAVEAEWFNGNISEDCRDRLLAAAREDNGGAGVS